jgi:hypothetical protein
VRVVGGGDRQIAGGHAGVFLDIGRSDEVIRRGPTRAVPLNTEIAPRPAVPPPAVAVADDVASAVTNVARWC